MTAEMRLYLLALNGAALCLLALSLPALLPSRHRAARLVSDVLRLDAVRVSLAQAELGGIDARLWVAMRWGLSLGLGALVLAWFSVPVIGVLTALVVHHLMGMGLELRRRRAQERRQRALLDAIRFGAAVMSRAGSASQMLEALAGSGPFESRRIFAQIVALGDGSGTDGGLGRGVEIVRSRLRDPLLDDLALALSLHWRQGGRLVPALEAVVAEWEATLRLQREARAMRAGVEVSVLLLALLPFVFLLVLQIISPHLLAPLHTPAGEVVLALAVAWMVIGHGVLQRMTRAPDFERVSLVPEAAG